jgi:hypothetical protein
MAHLKLNTKQWLQLGKKLGYIKRAQEEGLGDLGDAMPDMPEMPGDAPVAAPGDAPVAAPGLPEMDDPGSLSMTFKGTISLMLTEESGGFATIAESKPGKGLDSTQVSLMRKIGGGVEIRPFGDSGRNHGGEKRNIGIWQFTDQDMNPAGEAISLCKNVTRGDVNGIVGLEREFRKESRHISVKSIKPELYAQMNPYNSEYDSYEDAVNRGAEFYVLIYATRTGYEFKPHTECQI